jgi:hypothetical protein
MGLGSEVGRRRRGGWVRDWGGGDAWQLLSMPERLLGVGGISNCQVRTRKGGGGGGGMQRSAHAGDEGGGEGAGRLPGAHIANIPR